ncbi:uncharacterized protein LOC127262193 [Andrographis paniculata]|uniref:uncharacterized protein LOC127262193 n=1 Tax=Andrographis paniculata TaxID=175694 RepID=UPI0021E72B83|nr:uncharacterized protein LOC127262193 [Andrographis paniculata]
MKDRTGAGAGGGSSHGVMDGSDIMELVENEKVFTNFVDHKFQELDTDCDGKLSVQDLHPAVKDIGAALGLPAQPQSDHIYSEVLSEFRHGKQEEISKTEFKEVLSDFLIGMAAGLKRDPVVILRIDGEDLLEFVTGPKFEKEIIPMYSDIINESPQGSLKEHLVKAFEKLTVDHGMPPATDPWVMANILEPALETAGVCHDSQPSLEKFLSEFRTSAENVVQLLKEQPAIVAHSRNIFDGSGVRRLLANEFELNKSLDYAAKIVPRDLNGMISMEYLRTALDSLAAAGFPSVGAADKMDRIMGDALKMCDAGNEKRVSELEFKKILTQILGSIVLQLEGSPVSVSVNSVVHEQLSPASTLLQQQSSP